MPVNLSAGPFSGFEQKRTPLVHLRESANVDPYATAVSIANEDHALASPATRHLPLDASERGQVDVVSPRPDRSPQPSGAVAQSHQKGPRSERQHNQEDPGRVESDVPAFLGQDQNPAQQSDGYWDHLTELRWPSHLLAGRGFYCLVHACLIGRTLERVESDGWSLDWASVPE